MKKMAGGPIAMGTRRTVTHLRVDMGTIAKMPHGNARSGRKSPASFAVGPGLSTIRNRTKTGTYGIGRIPVCSRIVLNTMKIHALDPVNAPSNRLPILVIGAYRGHFGLFVLITSRGRAVFDIFAEIHIYLSFFVTFLLIALLRIIITAAIACFSH